jgi:hypothetical protein
MTQKSEVPVCFAEETWNLASLVLIFEDLLEFYFNFVWRIVKLWNGIYLDITFLLWLMSSASFRLTNWTESEHSPVHSVLTTVYYLVYWLCLIRWPLVTGYGRNGATGQDWQTEIGRCCGWGWKWMRKKRKVNETLKATVRIADCDRSQTTGESGIFQLFVHVKLNVLA